MYFITSTLYGQQEHKQARIWKLNHFCHQIYQQKERNSEHSAQMLFEKHYWLHIGYIG